MSAKRLHSWLDSLVCLVIFLVSLVVYLAALAPGLSFKSIDGNELITVAYLLGLAHPTGYPLYTWLGKLFTLIPVGDVAYRVNLMSAVLGAAGVALVYAITRQLTFPGQPRLHWPRRLASAFTALMFAFSRAFWSQTGIAEVYAPNVFMVALTVWLLLKWAGARECNQRWALLWLLAFSFYFSLSMGMHMSNLGFAPAFLLFILLVDWRILIRPHEWLFALVFFGLGILQFLWLPFKAHTLTDALLLPNAPSTLRGMYIYTLGAFRQMKFAFPLAAIPDRIVLYLYLLKQQYFVIGLLLGVCGMVAMLIRRTKRFYLFVFMYLVQVFFFIQYRVFDLDVFFIPAHLCYAVFIGFGVYQVIEILRVWLEGQRGLLRWLVAPAVGLLLALVLATPLFQELRTNWEVNDYSEDFAIDDFYLNVWELLPDGSALLGRSGVMGYDMFYYRLVYDIRPDIYMQHLDTPHLSRSELVGYDLYTTLRLDAQQAGRGPGALPPGLLNAGSWHVPVLLGQSGSFFGGRRELALYHVTNEPPLLVVDDPQPQTPLGLRLGGLELVGYDLETDNLTPGGRLGLHLYWQIVDLGSERRLPLIATWLDGVHLETHQLGFGNLARYNQEVHPPREGTILEDYLVVIPSTIEKGVYTLFISLVDPFELTSRTNLPEEILELIQVEVR